MDAEACPGVMTTEDTMSVSFSVYPATDMAACTDDGSDCAASTSDDAAALGHATSASGTLDTPSSICPAVDMTTSAGDGSSRVTSACDVMVALDCWVF
jgi:hypothetical protein